MGWINGELSVGRDPYSDDPRDFVVWDGFLMPFSGTRAECEHYVRVHTGPGAAASSSPEGTPNA